MLRSVYSLGVVVTLALPAFIACQKSSSSSPDTEMTADATDAKGDTYDNEQIADAATQKGSVYDYTVTSLDGKPVALSQYKGKKILIVNTASECGFTPQYKGLEELAKARAGKLVVLGFPCNQFGGQEPGTAAQIGEFCEKNYGVTFPLMSKVDVKGAGAAPLYQHLKTATGAEPTWNFCKYLVDENGKVLRFYPSRVEPMSSELLADIDKA